MGDLIVKPKENAQADTLNILPCLCGKMPSVLPGDPEVEGNAWGAVQCKNESCPAKPAIYDGEDCADDRGPEVYKEHAIMRWNQWISGNWKIE